MRQWITDALAASDAVHCVTFPRSGHHFLVQALWACLGDDLRYCERPGLTTARGANFLKHHDEALRLAVRPRGRYLVQIRHPIPAAISRYEQMLRTGEIATDTRASFEAHARRQVDYWCRFFQKWVIGLREKSGIASRIVTYEDLTTRAASLVAEEILPFLPWASRTLSAEEVAARIEPGAAEPLLPMDGHFVRQGRAREVRSFRHFEPTACQALLEPVRRLPGAKEYGYTAIDAGR